MKTIKNKKIEQRMRKHRKIRSEISGTKEIPRLSVFKSNKYVYAQIIDDTKATTLVCADSLKMKGKVMDNAKEVGKNIAKVAIEKNISKVVFDRGGFVYTGRIKAIADAAREGGLKF